jgi:hypothetical protein
MNKNDLNNAKCNKLLVVSKQTVIDKIKDFFRNVFKILKKEVREETKIPIIQEVEEIDVITELQSKEKITNRPKYNNDKSYYKMIYKGINEGRCTFEDLSPSEILTVMKMQKVENEFILNKLQQAMDNY